MHSGGEAVEPVTIAVDKLSAGTGTCKHLVLFDGQPCRVGLDGRTRFVEANTWLTWCAQLGRWPKSQRVKVSRGRRRELNDVGFA